MIKKKCTIGLHAGGTIWMASDFDAPLEGFERDKNEDMKTGILLLNMGGPEKLTDVHQFLYNLFSDPEIVRLPIKLFQKPLAWFISTTRYKKSSSYYSQIGGGSPLRKITMQQADELKKELAKRGNDVSVYVGMRYWHPFTAETLNAIERDGIDKLIVLPLYPQFSVSTTGSSFKDLDSLIEKRKELKKISRIDIIDWHDHPSYINVVAAQIKEEIKNFPNPEAQSVHILFSAHSVPESYITNGDPYLAQTQKTVELVMKQLDFLPTHSLSFQSKVGPVKWLEPSTDSMLRSLKDQEMNQVLVVPISFVSDHIETLYELDILYKKLANEIGIKSYRRVPALNCHLEFISALADIVVDKKR